jgi:hypothetical protein
MHMIDIKLTLGERILLAARLAAARHVELAQTDSQTNDDARPRRRRAGQRMTPTTGGAGAGGITDDPHPLQPSNGAREPETDIRSRAPRVYFREGAD